MKQKDVVIIYCNYQRFSFSYLDFRIMGNKFMLFINYFVYSVVV